MAVGHRCQGAEAVPGAAAEAIPGSGTPERSQHW